MADSQPKKRTFKRYTYKGIDLEDLVKMERDKFVKMLRCRPKRRLANREVPHKYIRFYKKCVAAKKDVPLGEKPKAVKTHLRDAVILPELVGSVVGIYNGRNFVPVEIKPDMIGRFLAEFSISYKPVKHGRPGIGASKGSTAVDLK